MLIRSLKIERLALKDYFANGDHLIERDDELEDFDSDVMYHGGGHSAPKKNKPGKKQESVGCCQRIFGSTLGSQGSN